MFDFDRWDTLTAYRTSAPPPLWGGGGGALVLHFCWTLRSRSCCRGDLLLLERPAADDSAGHPRRGHRTRCCSVV
ncbi:unnamed protein product [Brassica napus]|uniref:(rape) hypothetical protein n=1 Tax=Brassica napus TaxID=3708 RepID=A0A816KIV0_BRANA|nr:unnamed protein product [Brassica napus]